MGLHICIFVQAGPKLQVNPRNAFINKHSSEYMNAPSHIKVLLGINTALFAFMGDRGAGLRVALLMQKTSAVPSEVGTGTRGRSFMVLGSASIFSVTGIEVSVCSTLGILTKWSLSAISSKFP